MSLTPTTVFDMQAELCSAMAHPMRLKVIHLLRNGAQKVNSIAEALQVHQSTISRHLSVLRKAGILVSTREGADIFYHVANPKIVNICETMHDVLAERESELSEILVQFEEMLSTQG